jgi:pimeloyl-ACP methyl ester carboxylesterase
MPPHDHWCFCSTSAAIWTIGTRRYWMHWPAIFARSEGRDEGTDWATRNAHYDAVVQWGIPNRSMIERLTAITHPVFVANGDSDRMILPRYSHLMAGLLPNAAIKIYPDAGHGFLFQHHVEFADDVSAFLRD